MKVKLLFLLFASALITSCCTQKDCEEETHVHVTFHGFNLSDVDTVYVTGYRMGSNFAEVIQPQFADTVIPDGDKYLLANTSAATGMELGLIDTAEWKVYIPSVNKTLLINNYGYSTFKCNACFPVSPPSNKIHSLSTCSVNGVTTYVHQVDVQK